MIAVAGTGSGKLSLERDLLAEMAGLAADQGGDDSAQWASLAKSVTKIDLKNQDDLSTERQLVQEAARARKLLLRRGHRMEEEFERSPDLSTHRTLPSGERLQLGYERSLPVDALERKLAASGRVLPGGWHRGTVAFSSGMAAITNLVQSLTYMLSPSENRPMHVDFWGDYFETGALLQYLSGATVRTRRLAPHDLPMAWSGPDPADVLLIEPIRYNWSLDALNVSRLVNGWRRGPARAPIIILDTTLASPAWPTAAFLDALASPAGAPLVVEVRSGLKLDQQGMEVSNLGVVDIFQHDHAMNPALTVRHVEETVKAARGITGACPSAAAVAALDAPFLLDERWTQIHSGRLFLNNAWLAERLANCTDGLFRSFAHPSLSEGSSRANAPFIVCELRENTLDNHAVLLAVVRKEIEQRRLNIVYGNSFGFRTTRFDLIVPRKTEGNALFKVAAGALGGPSLDRFCEILGEIASYPSIAKLRETYNMDAVKWK
ncbi:hypothetical protein OHA98_16725 [Streptomyces sp. NBC_00654]|uniref:hypothetical protein n=1 Tax=Streptomyces sp. NBC_00654 TaxID=2975799 RepID=UPI0022595F58|nr:hypothetical protein [Streptomyces sp. NBC_00654]MCX4966449.1 hypothetical protein [Streptomyces sp. NBC_00654]